MWLSSPQSVAFAEAALKPIKELRMDKECYQGIWSQYFELISFKNLQAEIKKYESS
jgi:hypothetical protein